jgi:hypothetical protein
MGRDKRSLIWQKEKYWWFVFSLTYNKQYESFPSNQEGAGRKELSVTKCKTKAQLEHFIKDPARLQWHEVKKVDHYYLSIDAVTQPMQVQEKEAYHGK